MTRGGFISSAFKGEQRQYVTAQPGLAQCVKRKVPLIVRRMLCNRPRFPQRILIAQWDKLGEYNISIYGLKIHVLFYDHSQYIMRYHWLTEAILVAHFLLWVRNVF